MKQKLFLVLVILFSVHLGFRIFEYRNEYLKPYNAAFWKQRYEYSQWSTKPACEKLDPHYNPYTCLWDDDWYQANKEDMKGFELKKKPVGDDTVYTYAGWEYIHGKDPTLLNAETPPFGKYLIGLSEVVFKNQNIFALLSGFFALGALFFFSLQIFKDKIRAFIPVALLSFEPLFYTQLRAPYLDLLYLGLLLMTFAFFLRKQFLVSALFLGLMAATKSAASTFPLIIGVLVVYLVLTKQFKSLKKYALSLPFAGAVFTLTYLQFFLLGNSFREFLGVQKWVINFYSSGAQGSLTAPWEMIFTGKWQTWWGETSPITEWHFGWPILLILSAYALFVIIKTKTRKPVLLCALWAAAYLVFLSFIPAWPRYLLVVLPFLYNLAIWGILNRKNSFI